MNSLKWLPPWHVTTDSNQAGGLGAELKRELSEKHVLFGIHATVVGRRGDTDDVLFQLDSGEHKYAVVHLTWSGKIESNPKWPWTHLYKDEQDWIENGLMKDTAFLEKVRKINEKEDPEL